MKNPIQTVFRIATLLLCLLVVALGANVAHAKNIKKQNLLELMGNHGSTYTFRQFGLLEPRTMENGRVNLMVTPAGWPTYTEGEQVMLFLHRKASKTGFQTTAGLTQGKFTIRGDKIANGIGNDALFERMQINGKMDSAQRSLVRKPGGAFSTDAFVSLVKSAVENNWIKSGVMTHEK